MNKVFKVIWSEARNAYVVVSEMAKSHGTKSCSTKKLLAMLIATGVMTCASMAPAMADNPAPDDKNIAIGSGASTNTYNYNNVYGDKPITGDIAIGQKAYAWNGGYNEGQDIYIGTHEYYMDFGQGGIVLDHSTWRKDYYKVVDGSKVAGSIAIGKNSVARTGSTILGDHTYNGKIGDTEITSKTNYMNIQPAVFSTTIGSNTYNAGTLATVTGAFSIASSQFNGSGNTNTVYYGAQNTGATIYGSMNSIESATSNDWATRGYSGIASSVLGFANRTQNANAALIWGTGNEITNSIEAVTGVDFKKWNSMSVSDAQKDAIEAMQSNQYAGGSVMAIGGGNKADYTTYSELTGVQNKVTGTEAKAAKYDFVNGYQNTVTEASDVTVIGIKNEVTADGNKVIGDNHKVSGKDNVIFGSADQLTETTVNNAVVLGHNAKVTGEGGVALGAGSVADRANAVSVGSTGANRQIINVAAGTEDTDAVNVSQLQKVSDTANAGWNLATNGFGTEATNVKPGDYVDFSGDKNISVSHDGTKVQVELNKNIDVNSIQTNALNAKYNLSVGTMAENGIMPFLVNSTGAFYAANNNFSVDKDGKVIATAGEIGNVVLKNGVYTGNSALRDGELYLGDASGNYSQITTTGAKLGQVTIAADGKISGVAAGTEDTDAVNLSQLNAVKETANKGWNLSTNGGEASKVAPDATVDFSGDKNISVSHDGTKVQVELNKNIDVNSIQTNALNAKYNLSVGTMAENGIMPFLVNSTGAFYAANNNFSVDKDGKVIATAGEIGNVVLKNGVYTGNSALRDGELYLGDASGNYSQITTTGAKLGQVTIAADGKISGVAAGEVSSTSTDAINGSQLHAVKTELQTSDKHLVGNPASADGYYKPDANGDISLRVEDQNKNGYDVVIKDVASKAELGDVANRVTNVENKVTQIETDVTTIKTDITTIKTDITTIKTDINNINTRVDNVEALAGKHTTLEKNGTNINVEETVVDGQKNYKVNLNKDITLGDENGNNVSISGTNGTITATGDITTANRINAANGGKLADIDVTGNKLSNGNSSITLDGTNVKVNDKVTVDKDGKISGVAKGDISNTSTDAVNGSQLYDTNTHITNVENQVISNSNRINQLGNRVNKVGAGAAALAALHPMDFDPDDKLTFSAGYGNYGGENAAAIGAYYRPDEKVMFSVAGTVGNGENMVNAGVSFALDRTNHVSNSRTALAREVIDLRGQLAVMGAKMAKMEKAFGMLDETKTKLFPDVPANHWAYEYIAKLAGNGYIEGYPDGNFGGDRLMTRYEFAAMLYRAIEKGAALEEKIIKEFEPELGRIRVDRISGEDGDRDKIERVRVNDTKGERDHYGNKLAK
mgnify:CR=1 FL=1